MNTPFKGVGYPWKVFKIPLSLATLCKSILMHTHKLQRWTNSIEEPHPAGPLPPVKELCGVKGGFPQCSLSVVGRVIRNFCHISLEKEPFQICTCLHFKVSDPKKYDAGIEWD